MVFERLKDMDLMAPEMMYNLLYLDRVVSNLFTQS